VFTRVLMVGYRVETPVYQGPLDVLVHLVNTHEVDVLEVPLAPVVDAFVRHLEEHRVELELGVASEFLLLVAILLEVKSKTLLPGPDAVEEDEELQGWDSRDVLLARLLECQAYAAAGEVFSVLMERAKLSLPREVGLDQDFVVHAPDLLAGVSGEQLARAFRRVTAVRPEPRIDLSHVTVDTVSVSEAVAELRMALPGRGAATFRSLTESLPTRMDVIVRFLALLELCKLGQVALGQGRTFGDLQVEWLGDDGHPQPVDPGSREVDDYDG
jgi:segregation and condensation protein A